MPLGHSVGFWGSSVPSVAQFIAARSLSVPGSLTEPTGAQPGDRSYLITRGYKLNGFEVSQPASGVTPPTGWSLYAWNNSDTDYVVFTKVRGASADGPATIVSEPITSGSTKIMAGSDWSAAAATWAVVRGTTVAGNSGGHGEDQVATGEPASTGSLSGSGSLEVFGTLGGFQLNTASGWTKVHEYATGQDIGTWFTRDNPPDPTGNTDFTKAGGGGGASQGFDLHLILSA
jgi:hypothetical protein